MMKADIRPEEMEYAKKKNEGQVQTRLKTLFGS
jgi:hypothetical protein